MAEAQRLYRQVLALREHLFGKDDPGELWTLNNLANIDQRQGNLAEAEVLDQQVLILRKRLMGKEHLDTLHSVDNLARVYVGERQFDHAVDTWTDGLSSLPEFLASGSAQRDAKGNVKLPLDLAGYFQAVSRSNLVAGDQARQSFVAQGWWTFGKLDVALSDLGARLATGNAALASTVRDFQDARDRLAGLRTAYARSFENTQGGEVQRKGLSDEIDKAQKSFDALKARIETEFPELAELTLPRSLTADEAQKLLHPGEGLVAYASTDDALYAWLVTPDKVAWKRIAEGKADLDKLVAALRAGVDLTGPAPKTQPTGRCAVTSSVEGMQDRAFDACKAKELYDMVLGAFDLSGINHLIVVPDGPLETIPFSMLVTGFDKNDKPHWLIEDRAVSTLPTTSSLRALRQAGERSLARAPKPYLGIAPVTFGNEGPASPLRSTLADLPGTENEVRFLSGLLGAGRDGYVIGAKATEAYVKYAPLSDYRVLSFATHGLLSRQASALTGGKITEPALVLDAGDGEDGLLTASEAAGLKLDAEWVLLSGCNTAAGEGSDAEGLSGLARAFFFAGARALLVSHWSVDDNSAMDLMVETMKRSAEQEHYGRAQALRQAMLTVMHEPGYGHPFFWAPFSLVGSGERQDYSQ